VRATVRWIAGNLPLMLLALALAALAWVVAAEEADPTRTERFPQPIPVMPAGLPEGMVIVGEFDERVQATVRVPESIRKSLKVEDFAVTVDLTGLEPGTHEVPIQMELKKQPSEVMGFEPEYVTLELQPLVERLVPVRVQTEGEPTLGYFKGDMTVNPSEVTVIGPSSYVSRVVQAATQISIQDADSDIEDGLRVQPVDSEGRSVSYVTLEPDVVNVRVPIELSVYYRSLVVKAVLEGNIAPGYFNPYIFVEPPAVTVFGSPDVIAALPGYIETEPIDVEGAKEDVIKQPALNVPPDVTVIPGQQVEVQIFIEPIQSSLTMEIEPELQGMSPGLTATVAPETVEVIVGGPLPLLETMEPGDVRIVLDLFELPPGTHQIEPQVVVPEGVTAQSILPATVQVEIFIPPTPTPTEE
jgi:YbbR domain-containing protein